MSITLSSNHHASDLNPWERDRVFCAPTAYDAAFDWDISSELSILLRRILSVRSESLAILVPACGTGRFAEGIASFGHAVTAFDINPSMVHFAKQHHCPPSVHYFVDDMRQPANGPRTRFDFAFLLCSSFRYLLSRHDALRHLQTMAAFLKTGARYVIEMGMNFRPIHVGVPIQWTVDRQSSVAHASWTLESLEPPFAVDDVYISYLNKRTGAHIIVKEKQPQFAWDYIDFNDLISQTDFVISNAYHPDGTIASNPNVPSRYYLVLEKQ
jgi:SAM-dependent methyltransferase